MNEITTTTTTTATNNGKVKIDRVKTNSIFTNMITRQIVIDVIIWCVVCIPVLGLYLLGKPVKLGFHCDDISIQYPYYPDSVSVPVLMAVGLGVPLALIIVSELSQIYRRRKSDRRLSEIWHAVIGIGVFLFGTMVTKVFTEVIKFSAGRLRPHFIDLCRPDFSKINCSIGFIMDYECTNTEVSDKLLRDSRLSFPSGHASFGVFSAVFVLFYLQYRLEVRSSYLLKPFLQSFVMLLAVWCCVTRVTDNKHFTFDVLGGALLGAVFAWIIFYILALPHLQNKSSNSKGDNSSFTANSDEEAHTPSPLLKADHNVIIIKEPTFKSKTMV